VAEPSCPKCGANYAKAELIRKQGRALVAAAPASAAVVEAPAGAPILGGGEEDRVDDPVLEWKFAVGAIPIALALGLVFHFLTPALQRIVFGMPVHELGHAVSAWLCGYTAVPTLWKTLVADSRGVIAPLALAGALVYMMVRAWRAEKTALVVLGAVLLFVQAIGTLGLRAHTAEMLFVFGGDGMGMVLAAALMASFFFGKGTQLYKGSLRWGFLAIGAAAFVDISATWWTALGNAGVIPFGENEGSGLSDPLRLLEEYHWSEDLIVRRYVAVSALSLLALLCVYAWGVLQAKRAKG
jgi:hypothetical protein